MTSRGEMQHLENVVYRVHALALFTEEVTTLPKETACARLKQRLSDLKLWDESADEKVLTLFRVGAIEGVAVLNHFKDRG